MDVAIVQRASCCGIEVRMDTAKWTNMTIAGFREQR